MKLIFTEQALQSLEQSCEFFEEVLKIPKAKVLELKRTLIRQSQSLLNFPMKGQIEVLHSNEEFNTED